MSNEMSLPVLECVALILLQLMLCFTEEEEEDTFDWASYLLDSDYTTHRGVFTNSLVTHLFMSTQCSRVLFSFM